MQQDILSFIEKNNINILIVHGLNTSNHTHRYIHEAIYNTFKYIKKIYHKKIDVYWINDKPLTLYNNTSNKFLIFSSPHYNTDKFLPILDNAYYILHYNKINYVTKDIIRKYDNLLKKKQAVKYVEFRCKNINKEKIDDSVFWYDKDDNSLHIPWATNLMPEEIDKNIDSIKSLKTIQYKYKNSYFCGSIWYRNKDTMNIWNNLCLKYNIKCELVREKNEKVHQKNIKDAYIAPAIQGKSHITSKDKFYVPCRIFKNISYGNIPVTNNIGVYNLFKDFLIFYDNDLEKLIVKYNAYINSLNDVKNFKKHKDDMIKVMTYVKENHTYLSRIKLLVNKLV